MKAYENDMKTFHNKMKATEKIKFSIVFCTVF